jgi:hypothetical protein
MALRVAATLRLVDHLGPDGATSADLAAATHTDPDGLARLLDHLAAIGVLDSAADRYRLTELGKPLLDGHPSGLRDDLDITSALGRAELAFTELTHTITTGQPGYPRRYGRDFWADLAADPLLRASFDTKMTRRLAEKTTSIAHGFDWGRYPRLVDVGGGHGSLLTAILTAHPRVHAQLIDLPDTAAHAAEAFTAAGLAQRATATAGSFFDPLPPSADAYILSDILHDWDDTHAHHILGRVAAAAGERGHVLIIEPVRGRDADTAIDLAMMVFFGGRERTHTELTDLAATHQLHLAATTNIATDRTLLEFHPHPSPR